MRMREWMRRLIFETEIFEEQSDEGDEGDECVRGG